MKQTLPILLAALLLSGGAALGDAPSSSGGNWPRWRGPNDSGSNEVGSYPAKWSATSNLLWKAPLPGKGCSTPVVWDHRIFITAPVNGEDAALAFDWDGKPLWQMAFGTERKGKNKNGSGCNPSPATDGESVFVYFKSGNLAALSLDGKQRWKTNLQERFGKDTLYWDLGSSPALTQKDVVIAVMQHGNSYLAAFDKITGDLHWRVSRDYETPTEGDHSYTTPIVFRQDGKEALLVWGGEHLTAHDAADGKVLWTCGDFNPHGTKNWPTVASPVIVGDMAIVPYGRGSRLHAIKLGGSGDVTATHRLWKREDTGSFVPTPVAYKGLVYLLHDQGQIECIDPAAGKTLWTGDLPKGRGSYYSSPSIADGKIYAAREDGAIFVARVDGKFEVLGQNDMGERVIASPVPIENRLLLRGDGFLYCVGER